MPCRSNLSVTSCHHFEDKTRGHPQEKWWDGKNPSKHCGGISGGIAMGDFTFRYIFYSMLPFWGLWYWLKIGCDIGNLYNKTGHNNIKSILGGI